MPRTPRGGPTGRPSKGGEKVSVRLSGEATAALARLREAGLSTTEAIERALVACGTAPTLP